MSLLFTTLAAFTTSAFAGPLDNYLGQTCDFSGISHLSQTNGWEVDLDVTQDAQNQVTVAANLIDDFGYVTACSGSGQAAGRGLRFSLDCGGAVGLYAAVVDIPTGEFVGTTVDRLNPWSVAVVSSDRVFTGCP